MNTQSHSQWPGDPLVLHVIPTPVARGAQREARALADQLDVPGVRAHRLLTIFDGPPEVATDLSLRIDGGRSPAQGYDVRVVSALRSLLKRLDPVLVVAHGGDPLKYLVPAVMGTRRPLVYYAIGTFAGPRDRRLRIWMWRLLLKRVNAVAAEGNEVRMECTDLLDVPARRVTMTPNGRDTLAFRPRDSQESSGVPMITFVGALTAGKRPDRFVDVVSAVRRRGVDCRAQVVGDGPLRSSLVEPARVAGVELLGSRSDVAELLRGSDVLVFPSLPAGEGMPGVLIEAGLSGLPVVATDVPGVRTIVESGVTGIVVNVDDLDAMARAVAELAGDADLRQAMGSAARQRCLDQFSLAAVADRWLKVLEPMLPAGAGQKSLESGTEGQR
jgi:glycosyltransferase involved in cell wall biosynthesis